jgi:hypothetical protein
MSKKNTDIAFGLVALTMIAAVCIVLGTWVVKGLWTFDC